MQRLDNHSVYESAKILREKWVLPLDDGKTVYISFLSDDETRNIFQVSHQITMDKGNEFICQLLVKMDSDGYWKALSCGSTFESLNSDNIKNTYIFIPNIAEQEKIGQYFANLDNLITLHRRKCDELKELKKAYYNNCSADCNYIISINQQNQHL
ncbi:MAG: restriction endonuclease subunit S [Solobacterium sp.]|nr:restriction endonuclease subunit S [Solobacterium sp.]